MNRRKADTRDDSADLVPKTSLAAVRADSSPQNDSSDLRAAPLQLVTPWGDGKLRGKCGKESTAVWICDQSRVGRQRATLIECGLPGRERGGLRRRGWDPKITDFASGFSNMGRRIGSDAPLVIEAIWLTSGEKAKRS